MATAVLLIILAAVLVAGVRFWRLSQSDRRSVDQYHTRIERMQQMDGLRSVEEPFGDGSPDDPATPHIRILRTDAPSGEGASKRPRAAAPEVEAEVTGWGPPVRLLAEPKPEREYMVEPALASDASALGGVGALSPLSCPVGGAGGPAGSVLRRLRHRGRRPGA
jgi:hypothetical protein